MRRSLLHLLLLAPLAACGHPALPLAAGTPTAAEAAVSSKGGRVVVQWRSPAAREAIARSTSLGEAWPIDSDGDEAFELPAGETLASFKRALGDAAVSVEPDFKMRLPLLQDESAADQQASERAGNKSSAKGGQYSMRLIRASEAWRVTRGNPDVKIAVIDSGIDDTHPDLAGQVAESTSVIGWRSRLGLGSSRDDNGHGTHCAGIAAASGASNLSGIAPHCKLLVVKALDRDGAGDTADIARGVNWAVDHGASVISMSMGGTEDARPLRQAIDRAIKRGVTVVAAMGNEGKALRNYPAAYPGVIAVGATNANDRVASYSTRGPWISVYAPGTGIVSTFPTYRCTLNTSGNASVGPGYGRLSGTSMSTPLVAGVAALLKSAHPHWTPAQIKQALESTSAPIDGGSEDRGGHGRIDAAAALGSDN